MIQILSDILFFLVVINPMSNMVLLSIFPKTYKKKELTKLSIEASIIAFIILLIFTVTGNLILQNVFQIDISALMIAGGIVMSYIGFKALNKGALFRTNSHQSLTDYAVVPLASPLIAGPGTISAAIIKTYSENTYLIIAALFCAILINMLFMIFATRLNDLLKKHNISGAMIRITGLFVMSIGINMALNGLTLFFNH